MGACDGGTLRPGRGRGVCMKTIIHIVGFLEGIAQQCVGRFGYLGVATDIGECQHLPLGTQDGRHFGVLVTVVGGKDSLHIINRKR